MSRHRDEHLDLCAALVLGGLGEAERRELESHLAEGCEPCEAELRALAGGAAVLALSVPQHRAPAGVRARVLARIEAGGARDGGGDVVPLPRRPRAGEAWRLLLAAAALIVAVGVGVTQWRRAEELGRELAQARTGNADLERKLDDERRWAALLESASTRTVQLAATPAGAPTLEASVHYDPATGRAILLAQAFTPPAARDYELWAITASGATSLGVVHADASGHATVRLENVARDGAVAAFAVSLEATGGSPDHHKPSGPVVMLGKLAG